MAKDLKGQDELMGFAGDRASRVRELEQSLGAMVDEFRRRDWTGPVLRDAEAVMRGREAAPGEYGRLRKRCELLECLLDGLLGRLHEDDPERDPIYAALVGCGLPNSGE